MTTTVYIGLIQSDLHAMSAFEIISSHTDQLVALRRYRTLSFVTNAPVGVCQQAVTACFEWVNPNKSRFTMNVGPWESEVEKPIVIRVQPTVPMRVSIPLPFKTLLPDVDVVTESVSWVFYVKDGIEANQVLSDWVISTQRGVGLLCNPIFESADIVVG